MPIYEYQCPSCSRVSEFFMKVDDPDPICGDCEVRNMPCKMQKMLSKGGTFILKGGGWYRDGYSKEKK
jgi:putative FmdB family regulatory protein